DPLPTVERVFFMLFTVEKQMQINTEAATPHHMAYHFKSKDKKRDGGLDMRWILAFKFTVYQIGTKPWVIRGKKVVSGKSFAAAAIAEKPTSTDTSDTNQLTEIMADLIKCFWTFRD
ncbi:UNVERIFIED_CONTAM: hypothetical protein Sindi_2664500, partial [Sesamum indicum]